MNNNFDNYEIDFIPRTNKSYYKNANRYQSNEILNSMKESLDNFLLNLRTKSTSNNISKEELENYYLSKSNIYNTLNVDFISPYENLLKQNELNKNNNIRTSMSKRANSSKSIFQKINASVINNNSIYDNLNNISNSFYDKNNVEIKHNNSMMCNESLALKNIKTKLRKQNSVNNNLNNNYSHNNYSVNSNSKKFFQNNKIDFPIKLINNKNNNINTIKNKKNKNMIKIPRQNKSQLLFNNNNSINNNNKILYINSLRNIKNILINIKKENNQNKNEIKNIYKYYTILSEQIQNKFQLFIQKYNNNISLKKSEGKKYNDLMEKYKLKEEELEEKNNKIFLLENDLSIKEEKINQLINKEFEYKQTISQFKKIMKDVKIALGNYEFMKEKQIELNNLLNKTKELNEKNEKMKKDIFLIRSKKKSISKENEKNKNLIDLYKTNYDNVLKEKEELKKENLKLNNEIQIIKKNNEKMTNIKVNNNIKIQKNLKLKEEINNLTKEKKELENKYKNLQKVSEENGKKNKIRNCNSSTNILRQKKFYNLSKFKNKSFVIFSTGKIKEQKSRFNKMKKFNKLVIENKMILTYKQIKTNKNKKSNGYDYLKDINELKDKVEQKNKYINILEKENNETKNSKNNQINKLTKMIKTLEEKNEKLKEEILNNNKDIENNKLKNIIEQMEKDKNKINQAKTVETSQLRIEISKLKIQIYNLNNELEKYKKKEINNDEFNDDENEVHRLYI